MAFFLNSPQLMRNRAGQQQISECFKWAFRPCPPFVLHLLQKPLLGGKMYNLTKKQRPKPR